MYAVIAIFLLFILCIILILVIHSLNRSIEGIHCFMKEVLDAGLDDRKITIAFIMIKYRLDRLKYLGEWKSLEKEILLKR